MREPLWSWPAWGLTVAAVALSGAIAFREGTLTRRGRARVDMGFLNHAGMWDDAVLLSAFNAIVVPWVAWQAWQLLLLVPGILLTIVMHRAWWHPERRRRDHVWPASSRDERTWRDALSVAGWAHVIYMSAQLTLVLLYFFTPVPPGVVYAASAILILHVFIGLLQPHWFFTGRLWHRGAGWPLAIALAGILAAAVFKLL